MMKQWYKLMFVSTFILCLLTGCWDELNIEERGFVLGTAVDIEKDQNRNDPIVELTNQFVIPRGIGSPGEGPGDVQAYNNATVKGDSIAKMTRNMATMTSRRPFYGHLKVLIFSKELAEQKNIMASITDLFIRNIQMRRSIKVVIAEGNAKDVLGIGEITEKTPANFINMTLERNANTLEMVNAVRLGRFQSKLLDEKSYVLPLIKNENEKLHTEGAAVFNGKEDKLIGTLSKKEVEGFNLITQRNKDGTIKVVVDDNLKMFQLNMSQGSIHVNVDDPRHIKVDIHIKAEGYLAEMFGSRSLLKDDRLQIISNEVEKEIKKLAMGTIEKSQKDLKVDFLGIGTKIKQKHYSVWKDIHDNWEDGEKYYENATFNVSVEATVHDTGATDRSKGKGREK